MRSSSSKPHDERRLWISSSAAKESILLMIPFAITLGRVSAINLLQLAFA
ncbi:hypothetical protein LguiA_029147 [Lonicera macranthoides]